MLKKREKECEGDCLRKHSKGSDWGPFIVFPLEVGVGAVVLGELIFKLPPEVVIDFERGESFGHG